jgi:AbrB family looped-hinge helix DNA binding protein
MPPITVTFTTKGQVVIPAKMREHFQIKPGTRAIVEQTEKGILMQPITAESIDRACGSLPSTGDFLKEWAEHKREERVLEDRQLDRFGAR